MTVLLFAAARDLAGAHAVEVPVETGATVGEVRAALAEAYPTLAALLPRCRVAVGRAFAGDEDVVPAGAEVALIPPVSGG